MPEFLRLVAPAEAVRLLFDAMPSPSPLLSETLPTSEALGRVLGGEITAPHQLPPFTRATVDGYAVRADDTHGASGSLPAYLAVIGEVFMGAAPDLSLARGQAALVHTGGMLPAGADAVVMVEDTQVAREGEVEILKPASTGQNVIQAGEDVQAREVILEAGVCLRPQEIGGLMALGIVEVQVVSQPRVAILSTGDEVIPPEAEQGPGQVRDVNSYTLSALVERAGGRPVRYGIIPDEVEALKRSVVQAHGESDLVIITAGSSVSTRDRTAEVISSLGKPGILVHGVSIKPGKPTILAVADEVPVIGLPGNPVSALVIADLFVKPTIQRLLGLQPPPWRPTVRARLAANVPSETGREDYLPVKLEETSEGYTAHPVYGRSNLIFTLVRADGLVRIPPEATGLGRGSQVEVQLF